MDTKPDRLDIEWWIVPKRLIYIVVALIAFSIVAGGAIIYVWTFGNPFSKAGGGAPVVAGARFDSFEGDVRVVRANTRETIPVRSDTRLLPGDIVQTQADGRARIALIDGSTLSIKPNSVITIAHNESEEDGKRTNVRVAVDRGQINVRTEQLKEGTRNVVETPLTNNRLTSQTGASFNVHEDKTEDIRVSMGEVETTSTRTNEKTTLREKEYVALGPAGNFKSRERLLDAPVPSAPREMERIPSNTNGAANVSLRWERPASGAPAYYRVEVATSPFFVPAGKVIERDQLAATEFNAGDLRPGNYFWRVRAAAVSAQVSEWSDPQKFIVVAGGAGDRITLSEVVIEYVAGNVYLVRGRTQAGTTVRIGEREMLADAQGYFRLQIRAPPNAQEVLLEAEDPQGNRYNFRIPLTPGTTSAIPTE